MVKTILTEQMINDGATLVHKLDEIQIHFDAAFWFYFQDVEKWKLVIADKRVGMNGPKEFYRKIQKSIAELEGTLIDLSLDDIALIKPDEPLISLLKFAVRTGPGISNIRFKNNVINGTVIEDAYIYRMN